MTLGSPFLIQSMSAMPQPERSFPSLPVYRFGSRQFDFNRGTYLMGILNVTPDSFSDGGKFLAPRNAVEHGLRMVEEGADIIDVGGESTRPRGKTYGRGAEKLPAEAEIARVVPVIEALAAKTAVPISVDTWKAPVAREALRAGAVIVNDISGFHFDPALPGVIAEAGGSAVLMHTPAPPWEMPPEVHYSHLVADVSRYLKEGIGFGLKAGVNQLLIDPGLGFGKNAAGNYELLRRLSELLTLGYPILVGASRKSFIGKALDLSVEDRLEGSLAALVIAALNGASVVRVHDVAASRKALAVADLYLRPERTPA